MKTAFGIPAAAFWMYVCAAIILIVGLIRIFPEVPKQRGLDKITPFGPLFFAIPMAVFASEHFTLTKNLAALVPRWIPGHTFWVYAVGVGFLLAAISLAARVQARLAAALVGITFLIFVLVMDLPNTLRLAHNRFFWALTMRELTFSSGAFAFALAPIVGSKSFPRFVAGAAAVFYGVENLLHPANAPGVPLELISAPWIPGRIFVSYFVGVVLIAAGVCMLANVRARLAATLLGLTILLAVLWVYLPMLIAKPTDIEALNYFFDTLLFCGTILMLAGATATAGAGRRHREIAAA